MTTMQGYAQPTNTKERLERLNKTECRIDVTYRCGACATAVGGQDAYCRYCGQPFFQTRKV